MGSADLIYTLDSAGLWLADLNNRTNASDVSVCTLHTFAVCPANPMRPAAEQAGERYDNSCRTSLEIAALLMEGKQQDIAANSNALGFGR